MGKRITLTLEDMVLITEALDNLSFVTISLGMRQRIKQITDKFHEEEK